MLMSPQSLAKFIDTASMGCLIAALIFTIISCVGVAFGRVLIWAVVGQTVCWFGVFAAIIVGVAIYTHSKDKE